MLKKLFGIFSLILCSGAPVFGQDWDAFAVRADRSTTIRENTYVDPFNPSLGGQPGYDTYHIDIYKYNKATGAEEVIVRFQQADESVIGTSDSWKMSQIDPSKSYYDHLNGKLIFKSSAANKQFSYDISSGSFSAGDYDAKLNEQSSYDLVYDFEVISGKESGELSVGIDDQIFMTKKSDGSVHIGENSLALKESGGREQMWATDANGNSIDIDIVNSSDLLINGKSVQGQIDSNAANISTNAANISANAKNISNLGTGIAAATSLTAALSALPAASTDSPFSCGVGTGGYSDKFALGVGCAAKINQRLNANIAASHVFGGSVDYGEDSLDTVAARAGFVFKFGKIDDSPKVAARKAAELRDEVAKLREENEAMRAESSMQQQINASLLARLERLERIASGRLSLLGDRASSD